MSESVAVSAVLKERLPVYPILSMATVSIFTLMLIYASVLEASPITPLRTQQQASHPNVYSDSGLAQHVYGYAFTPSSNGEITRVGGRFSGTKTIVLIDNESGLILGSADISGNTDSWTYTPFSNDPIIVEQDHSYTVAARMNSNASGRAMWGVGIPFSVQGLTVDAAVQGWSDSQDPVVWATSIQPITDQNMKGLLDIEFQTRADDPDPDNDDPDPDNGDCIVSGSSNLQTVTAAQSGCTVHESIDSRLSGNGRKEYWADFAGVVDTLSPACEDLHDRYWVTGPDGNVYATWHPAATIHPDTGEGCVFGHEHGDDPSTSPVFDYSGGWPPFGYVVKTKSSQRVEDHFGHKITVATYRAGIGNHPQDTAHQNVPPPAIHDAGFDCHWLSKLHQGSYSLDAYSNHLHEYFLTVRCDGEPIDTVEIDPWKVNSRTEFSIKALVPFGKPDSFFACGAREVSINEVTGPENQSLPPAQVTAPVAEGPNPRGFLCFNPLDRKINDGIVDSLNRFDLWTQPYAIEGPSGLSIKFQAYYIVKDTPRSLNSSATRIRWTTDLCAENPGLAFCADYEASGQPAWSSAESPFRGALRAVNFKRLAIYNNAQSDPASFCTDTHGKNPELPSVTGAPCPANMIEQKIAKKFETDANPNVAGQNLFDHLGISGSLFVYGQTMKYRKFNLSGRENPLIPSDYLFIGSDSTGLQPLPASGICPASGVYTELLPSLQSQYGNGYCPLGIGFEKIVDMRNEVDDKFAAVKSRVAINPATGQQFNTDLHAPN